MPPTLTRRVAIPVVAAWFRDEFRLGSSADANRDDYLRRLCRGGYPEPFEMEGRLRYRWFDSYVTTVLNRDIVVLGELRAMPAMHRLMRLAAASTATEVNLADWSRRLGIDRRTVESYLGWMRTVFLVHELPAWTRNRTRRAIKRPKLHMLDSGLAATLLRLDATALRHPNATMTGPLIETFTVNEIVKQISVADEAIDLHHFRDSTGREVDLVLEHTDGRLVAVEIKASASACALSDGQLGMAARLYGSSGTGIVQSGCPAAHRQPRAKAWRPLVYAADRATVDQMMETASCPRCG